MKYKAVCFDIDGTLYSPSQLREYMTELTFSHPIWVARYGRTRQMFRKCQADFEQMGLGENTFAEREAVMLMKVMPRKMDMEKARRKLDECYYRHLYDIFETLEPQVQSAETLAKIKKAGLTTAVFSDWPLYDKLERMGLDDFVDLKRCSDDAGYLKPDPRCFTYMLQELGLSGDEMLYVGDSYSKDVAGAAAAGVDAVLVGTAKEENKYPLALEVFRDWAEFDAWISGQLEA